MTLLRPRSALPPLCFWLVIGIVFLWRTVQGAGVTLAWDANPETDLAGYRVYFGLLGGSTNIVDVGNVTTNRLDALVEGETYFFFVTAYNLALLESDPSEILVHTIPASLIENKPPVIHYPTHLALTSSGSLNLNPSVYDELSGNETLSYRWEWIGGGLTEPLIKFEDRRQTEVFFPESGHYFLRLKVGDGQFETIHELLVTVYHQDDVNSGVTTTPEFISITPSPEGVLLIWASVPGEEYSIGYSNELGSGLWVMDPVPVASQGFYTSYIFPIEQGEGFRWFKIFEFFSH